MNDAPTSQLLCADSIAWMSHIENDGLPNHYGVFTSIPDISELPGLFGNSSNLKVTEYKVWFTDIVSLIMQKIAVNSYAIFLQSDVRVCGTNGDVICWIDKSFLCNKAAECNNCVLMWHKLVSTNKELGKRSTGRPTYSHFLCFKKILNCSMNVIPAESSCPSSATSNQGYRTGLFAVPDIFYRGEMLWPKGIGLDCCYVGVMFLKEVAHARCVLDPFAGKGTVVAMANALGIDGIGIELSAKRCRYASNLSLVDKLDLITPYLRSISLDVVHERQTHAHFHQKRCGGESEIVESSVGDATAISGSSPEVKSIVTKDGEESTIGCCISENGPN